MMKVSLFTALVLSVVCMVYADLFDDHGSTTIPIECDNLQLTRQCFDGLNKVVDRNDERGTLNGNYLFIYSPTEVTVRFEGKCEPGIALVKKVEACTVKGCLINPNHCFRNDLKIPPTPPNEPPSSKPLLSLEPLLPLLPLRPPLPTPPPSKAPSPYQKPRRL